MISLRFVPFDAWPGASNSKRRAGTFQVTYPKALDDLEKELRFLGAAQIVVSTGHSSADIRQDGWPRSNARKPWHPGVIVHFVSRHGPLAFACDTYTEWQALSRRACSNGPRWGIATDRVGAGGILRAGRRRRKSTKCLNTCVLRAPR